MRCSPTRRSTAAPLLMGVFWMTAAGCSFLIGDEPQPPLLDADASTQAGDAATGDGQSGDASSGDCDGPLPGCVYTPPSGWHQGTCESTCAGHCVAGACAHVQQVATTRGRTERLDDLVRSMGGETFLLAGARAELADGGAGDGHLLAIGHVAPSVVRGPWPGTTAVDEERALLAAGGGGLFVAHGQVTGAADDRDVLVERINPSGEMAWSQALGGPGLDRVQDVDVDGKHLVLVGTTESGLADAVGEGRAFVGLLDAAAEGQPSTVTGVRMAATKRVRWC